MSGWIVAAGGLGAVLVMMTALWAASVRRQDASLVDRVWGMAFVVYAWVYALLGGGSSAREVLMLVLVTVWGVRLSAYITYRNWGEGEDKRYAAMRERYDGNWDVASLFRVFWLQGILAFVIGVPLLAVATDATPEGLTWIDWLAVPMWLVGFAFEAGGDLQLHRFLADESNRGKVMDKGFWRYTRHPNYFGDTVQWLAYSLLGIATGAWWAIAGYLLMTAFIVKVSGVSLTEKNMSKGDSKREGYDEYVEKTNVFFPGPRGA